MKKMFKYASLGAIALVGAVSFSACSSSDEVVDNPDYNPVDNTVKTEFTISLPASAKAATRQSSTEVPDNNAFRGMENIILIPFADDATITSSSTRWGENITLPATGSSAANTIAIGDLVANNHSKLFNNVTIPVGTSSFLLYGKSIDGTVNSDALYHQYGYLTPPTFTGEPSTFTFSPKQIYETTGTPDKATAIANYLTAIANAKYSSDDDNNSSTPDVEHKWSGSTGGMKLFYDAFITNKAGSSNSVKELVKDLYNTLWKNTDNMSKAIVAAIKTKCTVPTTEDGTIISFDSSIDDYPTEIHLPDGAAAVAFNNSTGTFSPANGTIYNTSALTDYVYPASLYYFVNSGIKTDNSSKASEYVSTNTTWDVILGKYANDNASVQPTTRSVAIKNPINYAVGRFDVTIKAAANSSETNVLYDYNGDPVDISTTGFTVTAVLIGGQNSVGFDFTPSAEGTSVIYDNAVASGTKATTTASTPNRTMVLETVAEKDVTVVVELVNDVADFYGKDGQLIKKDTKFYLLGTLTATAATETGGKVFKQDYVTTANFTINVGTKKGSDQFDHNDDGLGGAYNVIPDLRTPQLELGMSVDLTWTPGHTFNIEI